MTRISILLHLHFFIKTRFWERHRASLGEISVHPYRGSPSRSFMVFGSPNRAVELCTNKTSVTSQPPGYVLPSTQLLKIQYKHATIEVPLFRKFTF